MARVPRLTIDPHRRASAAAVCPRPPSIAFVVARGIHHLGVAVDDLDEALATYERLFGATLEHRATVPEQGVEAAAVLVGPGRVELLAPTGDDTPVGRFLAGRGPGMHHVAYEVGDVAAALADLAAAGAQLIDERPRRGLFGLEVAFIHPDAVHGVLAEVVSVAETESVRIEIGFDGGQIMSALSSPDGADSLEQRARDERAAADRARRERRPLHDRARAASSTSSASPASRRRLRPVTAPVRSSRTGTPRR